MSGKVAAGINTREGWDRNWIKVFDHYQNDIRHAHYVRALLNGDERRVLEIAAGSFRDVVALNRWQVDCSGVDYSTESVRRAKARSPDLAHKIVAGDAFCLRADTGIHDVTFHNGFWGYFDDEDIGKLAREQARVTRKRMIATVHNAHNLTFAEYFQRKAVLDPLFRIRFFSIGEISNLMRSVCAAVTVIPVGKGKTSYEDAMIARGDDSPDQIRRHLLESGTRLLDVSERLLCIGEV